MNKQKIIAFDLDDVICFRNDEYEKLGPKKYDYCQPYPENIEIVNSLYDEGHRIIVYTARGMSQFDGNVELIYENLYQKTKDHLKEWGLKYHSLVMGKIQYDVLVDDKALNSNAIDKQVIKTFIGL